MLLFLITLAGLVLDSTESLKRDLYSYLFQILPISAYDLVQRTLDEVIENSSSGKLTIGLLITLWSASVGVDALRNSLNSAYELTECRPYWKTKLQSLGFTLLFIVLLTVALLAVSAGLQIFEKLLMLAGFDLASPGISTGAQWFAVLALLLFTSEVIYNWLPCHRKFHFFWATPGSAVAVVLWVLLSGGFRVYLQYFDSYNKAYGSLGAVIILMLWMYLTATAILLGASINSVLMEVAEVTEEDKKEIEATINPS